MAASRSSRTPLMAALRKCFRQASRPGIPHSPDSAWNLDRRSFLTGAMLLGAGALLPGCRRPDSSGKAGTSGGASGASAGTGAPPRVAIVGAGIAGLSAAHHLSKAGIRAEIFEAGSRAGGRILTLKDVVVPGLYTEAGGEFIDSSHADMLGLARELGLPISDMRGGSFAGLHPNAWHFGGRLRSDAEVLAEVKASAERLQADIDALPDVIQAGTGGLAQELDRMSLEEYLRDRGVTGWFGDLLKAAYVSEFGLDPGEQSSLNLLTLVSLDSSGGEFAVYGDSDERYRVEGGNQGVTDGLAGRLEPQLRPGHRLEALDGKDGDFRLSFQGPAGAVEHRAEAVILALPFTLLRSVDIRVDLPPLKRRAIAELGMGTNSKLFAGFKERSWRKNGYLGYFYSDGGIQSGWDHSQTQAGEAGGLTLFQGGAAGLALGGGSPDSKLAALAGDLETLYPGSRAAHNGRAAIFHWPEFPLSLGSYACYKPGQWTGFGGEEGKPVGDLHFAGEQCSGDFQGYMNGGAETGRVAAEAVITKWKKSGT